MDDKEYLKCIGMRISKLRLERNWTQEDFAMKLGVKRMQVYRIEKGQNSLGILTLRRIADVLEVSIRELVD